MDDVDFNCRATVVKEIIHINFTTLTFLDFDGNIIDSIEGLPPRVQMPHVKSIYLYTQNKGNITDEQGCVACPGRTKNQ